MFSSPCRSGFRGIEARTLRSALTLSLFLSIFPLILVAVSVMGFVSAGNPDFVTDTINSLNLTGDAQGIFTNAVNSAQANRGAVGLIGLLTGAWSALGVTTALQVAANVPWQVAGRGIKDKAVGVLFLLGAAVVSSGLQWPAGQLACSRAGRAPPARSCRLQCRCCCSAGCTGCCAGMG